MEPLQYEELRGNWASVALHINPDDSIDHVKLEEEISFLVNSGVNGVYTMMKRDISQALEVEKRIQQFMNEHIVPFITQQGYANQALDKLLAAIGAWSDIGTRLRWPYRWIAEKEAERLRSIARKMIPELFPT